jgi:hypothetical protein
VAELQTIQAIKEPVMSTTSQTGGDDGSVRISSCDDIAAAVQIEELDLLNAPSQRLRARVPILLPHPWTRT